MWKALRQEYVKIFIWRYVGFAGSGADGGGRRGGVHGVAAGRAGVAPRAGGRAVPGAGEHAAALRTQPYASRGEIADQLLFNTVHLL